MATTRKKHTQPYMPDIDYSHAIFHYLGYIWKPDYFNCQSQAIFGLEAKFLRSACVHFFCWSAKRSESSCKHKSIYPYFTLRFSHFPLASGLESGQKVDCQSKCFEYIACIGRRSVIKSQEQRLSVIHINIDVSTFTSSFSASVPVMLTRGQKIARNGSVEQ